MVLVAEMHMVAERVVGLAVEVVERARSERVVVLRVVKFRQ